MRPIIVLVLLLCSPVGPNPLTPLAPFARAGQRCTLPRHCAVALAANTLTGRCSPAICSATPFGPGSLFLASGEFPARSLRLLTRG